MAITLATLAAILTGLGAAGGGTYMGISSDANTLGSTELKHIRKRLDSGGTYDGVDYGAIAAQLNANPYWNSRTDSEKDAIIQEYFIQGKTDKEEAIAWDTLLRDLGEYDLITQAAPDWNDTPSFESILADAESAIEAENEELLASLNQELANTSEAYTNSRNALLTQQYQRNAQTIDAMASDMARARRNAIEAGASAGVRIAGNVNALLSAQNKMSQQSLETSNQLAQMLVNQRNAEADLRSQWRDVKMSTYDRTQNRAQSIYSTEQAKYDDNTKRWQSEIDKKLSPSNRLSDRMAQYYTNSKYKVS